jgi:hypothetical protein
MKITLSPLASTYTTTVSVDDLTITIDGTPVDLSVIPVGGYAEPDDDSPFIGKVTRDEVKVRYHYDSALAEPNQSTDWADYTFPDADGVLPDPIVRKPEPEPEPEIEPEPEPEEQDDAN